MDAADQVAVPILFRLGHRSTNGKEVDSGSLALHLRHLPVTEGLSERRKPLKQVSNLAHCGKSEWRTRWMQLPVSGGARGRPGAPPRISLILNGMGSRGFSGAQLLLLDRHARPRFLRLLYESEAPRAE